MLSHADRTKLAEARARLRTHSVTLSEGISQSDLETGLKALSHLRRVDFSAIPSLKRALGAAVDEVNKSLGDERGLAVKAFDVAKRAFQALRTRSTEPLKNPIAKALDITSAIRDGFAALPKVIEANVPDADEAADKSLIDAAAGKDDLLRTVLAKAFRCRSGAYDSADVADELLQLKVSVIAEMTKRVASAAKGVSTKPEASKPTQPTTASEPSKPSAASSTQEPQRDDLTAALDRIKRASGVAPPQFKAVMNAISQSGWKLAKR